MTPADELLAHLKHFEGFVGHPYRCAAGYLTLGYGHRITEAERRIISEPEAEQLLRLDIKHYRLNALRLSPVLALAGERRLNAIIDFCLNAGIGAYSESRLRQKVALREWPLAATQLNRWVWITDPKTKKKIKSSWQIKRRAACAAWLLQG